MSRPITWQAIVSALRARQDDVPASNRWLFLQTMSLGGSQRALLRSLPLPKGSRVADVGCGFGAVAIDLACLHEISVIGVDVDPDVLRIASDLAGTLLKEHRLESAMAASFMLGDVGALPMSAGSLDGVIARFLFQHLTDTTRAVEDLARVVRPGGVACLVDVDDGLSISHPAPSAAFSRLAEALKFVQGSRGGDRFVGRKMAGLLDEGGFTPSRVLLVPQAGYQRSGPGDPSRRFLVERLGSFRDEVVESGFMSAAEFDDCLGAFSLEDPGPVCEIEAAVAVIAHRR